ncbi:AAA family ATPase [Paractinoplanes hotanensis]|uniref:AAA family ATPase n=1 Tax=Paractinoplanes hotanensis TaxID=2906497 RepID=A0ABT0YH70_9ACTN|nr:AAA family ATPase [Actinoplanes hotanensis]MCM4084574.1 AAA family ATPase [Actinoplanes hotanensis]
MNASSTASGTSRLAIIRGNSGSGKSSVAREVRRRYGRGCALVEQDYLRRIVCREHDISGIDPVAPAFIASTVASLLGLGYHVVLEGILHRERYGEVLRRLIGEHRGPSAVYYLDVPFEETVRRHQTRAASVDFTVDDMAQWYAERDLLGVSGEHVIGANSTLSDTAETILRASGLVTAAPLTPCPTRCARCEEKTAPAHQ